MFLGRVVRPGVDPQWLPTDAGLALAWQQDKAETCACGTRPDEWAADRDAYVSAHHYCRGHELLAMETANLPKDSDGKSLPGFIPHLVPRALAGDLPDDDDE